MMEADSEADMADPLTPATPDLFNSSSAAYYSDGRATPDDTSSLDGMTTATACQPKRKRRGRPPVYLSGEPMDGWTDLDKGTQYKVGGKFSIYLQEEFKFLYFTNSHLIL